MSTATIEEDGTIPGEWMTVDDCLQQLRIGRSTWEKWRQRGVAPRAKRLPNGQLRVHRDWWTQWLHDLPENL